MIPIVNGYNFVLYTPSVHIHVTKSYHHRTDFQWHSHTQVHAWSIHTKTAYSMHLATNKNTEI